MFVRFRVVRHRLVVNLVATRRERGKIVSEHVARLGSAALPEPISAAERILFWRDLKDRWRDLIDRLGNRVTADDRKKALAAITEAEEQAMRVAALRNTVEEWEGLQTLSSKLKLASGGRLDGDDEMALNYVVNLANKRDAYIRSEPRPAARGKRGRQKRRHWLRIAEEAP
jgi:hypothetical protein